jgi:hypothetical protein
MGTVDGISGVIAATASEKRAFMEWFDRKIVEYVITWAPYGPLRDEEVFPEFGMGVWQLRSRFSAIVTKLAARADLDEVDRTMVARVGKLSPPGWIDGAALTQRSREGT